MLEGFHWCKRYGCQRSPKESNTTDEIQEVPEPKSRAFMNSKQMMVIDEVMANIHQERTFKSALSRYAVGTSDQERPMSLSGFILEHS